MEIKEFENVKVVYIPELELEGVVEYESDDKKKMTIYSIEFDICWDKGLSVTEIIDSIVQVHEVTSYRRSEIINEIFNSNFYFCTFRSVVGDELYIKDEYYRADSLVKMHTDKIREFINNNKNNNNKSMETEKIIIPYYLEYVNCVECESDGNPPIFIFGTASSRDYFYITYKEDCVSCTKSESSMGWKKLFAGDDREKFYEGLEPLWKMLINKSFDDIDFKLFWSNGNCTDRISKNDKNQFFLAILNCLNMNLSPKNAINDRVTMFWNLAKNNDIRRFQNPYKGYRKVGLIEQSLWEQGRYFSEEVYKHFKNYSMKDKINLNNVECILDIETGISLVKLDVKEQNSCGGFYLVGLKKKFDESYCLVIKEIPNSGLKYNQYSPLNRDEGIDLISELIDRNTNISSVLFIRDSCGTWEKIETNNVNDYIKYIKLLTDKVTNGDNGETEEERISREFNVNCLVKIAEGIGKRIDRDRKYITKEDISPILDGLQSTINYLKYIEPKD